ncbi:MAG TPA: HAD-IA family hydrolase [Planctomycetota bacterium]|nr:HAD-IA family hydrolase [Planctomycetota bacterium]
MYGSVLFDLDGTLIDSAPDIAASVDAVRSSYGLEALSLADVTAAIGDGVANLMQRTVPGASGDEALRRYLEHHEVHCLDATKLYPGVREGLERLSARLPLAVVSNKPFPLTHRILTGLGVAGAFKAVVGGDSGAGRKPEPGPVLAALERLERVPWTALVVGDSPGDVAAGRAAGAATCGVTWGYRSAASLREAGADSMVETFGAIVDLVESAPPTVFAAVGAETFHHLARAFYARVDGDPRLRAMFPPDLKAAAERQALFLIQFFGGPSDYSKQRGAPRLRMRHAPFRIDVAAREAWLSNMRGAIDEVGIAAPARGVLERYFEHTARMLQNA